MKKIYYSIIFCLSMCAILTSCSNEVDSDGNGPVKFRLELNSTGRDQILNNPYTYKMFTSARLSGEMLGVSGLLVFSYGILDGDIPSLVAFDLCCPYENRADVRVVPDDNFKATCTKCGSVYDFAGQGLKVSGPATRGLFTYSNIRAEYPYTGYFNIRN